MWVWNSNVAEHPVPDTTGLSGIELVLGVAPGGALLLDLHLAAAFFHQALELRPAERLVAVFSGVAPSCPGGVFRLILCV